MPPLYPHDKWFFWLHEQARPWTFVPVFLSGGYGQLADSPHYGSDRGAFGERLGAAYIRDATMRFFCDSFVPVLSREDPRYHRKAYGKYLSRAGWAAERSFVIQRDNGRTGFNYSDIVGHLAASALIPLYYPGPSANAGVVFETWATSIAGDAGNKILLEFLPDALNAWRRHRHAHHRGSSRTR